ncbi:MAG TPA: hypothetical protein VKH82_10080 [Candidatus Binatia bacterium]|nr:hypothetical protein [Candidatus Binatia bacterium]
MSSRLGWVFGLLVPLLVWSSPAGAQCGGTQLCAAGAGDCTIASSCTITVPAGGLTIDLGARKLVLTKTLTVQGAAVLTINAGSLLVDGGSIIAPGASGIGGSLSILAATSMTFQNDALVDVSAGVAGGIVDLEALNGDLNYSGRIKANGTTRDGDGGAVSLSATGNMTVAGGTVDASGGDRAGGGFIDIEVTNGSLLVSSTLSAPGGDGGDLILVGGTSLQTTASADIDVSASGDAGSGGSIDLSASGDLSIAGNADGTGAVSADPTFSDGGDGADYYLTSDTGSITVTGQADMSAASGGSGGQIDFEAGLDLTVLKPMATMSTGADGVGGDVTFFAGRNLSVPQPVNASGGTGSGGTTDVEAGANADVAGQLVVDGTLVAGQNFLSGCTVTVESNALLSAQGPSAGMAGAAMNIVQAGSAMTIAGTLKAGDQNLLTYRQPPAPVTTGATIVPAPTIQQDPNIPCCVACPVTTTTSTTTSLPTTSTTSSTSTTAVVPTTTSSTTTSSTSTTTIHTTTTSTTTSSSTSTTASSTTTTSTSTTTSTTETSTTTTAAPTTSTSTTTTPASSSTTTTLSGDCTEQPLEGLDAVDCRIDVLSTAIGDESPDEFGGPRKTHAQIQRLDNARDLVNAARQGTKVRTKLRLAIRQLRTLNRALQKTINTGKTPPDVGAFLSARVSEALAELETLQASAPNVRR